MVANDRQLPTKKYVELDINFLGLKVLNVGFLILEEPNRVLDKKHQTKLPDIIGWNLIWLTYKVFIEKYEGEKFNSFECLAGVNPLLFSQLCLYHYGETSKEHDSEVQFIYHQTDKENKSIPSKSADLAKRKVQPSFIRKDGLTGQVIIDSNSTITILGCTNKSWPRINCLVEQVEHHNLPLGIVINQCVAIPKGRTIPMVTINTNRYKEWVRQPLLAAELYDAECTEIEYRPTGGWEHYYQVPTCSSPANQHQ